jgi:DNA-directed RNA polymerase, subunit K/omega
MKAVLIQAASEIIPNPQILVNVVSRRVRQLSFGHRPMVQVPPGTREADIALMEIIEKKLTYESTFGQKYAGAPVVPFPGNAAVTTKAA